MSKITSKKLGIVISYLYFFANTVLSLVLSAVLLRSVGDDEYGVYQIVTSFTAYLALLNFGTGTIMTRNIAASRMKNDRQDETENVSTLVWMTWSILGVIVLVGTGMYFSLDLIYSQSLTPVQLAEAKPMFLCVCLNLVLSIFLQTIEGIINGNEHFIVPRIVGLVRVLLRSLLVIVTLQFVPDVMVVVVTDVVLNALCTVFSVLYCRKWYVLHEMFSPRYVRKAIFRASFPFAMAMILQVFVNQAVTQIPKFITGIYMKPVDVTILSLAIYVYQMFSSVLSMPVSVFLPSVVQQIEGKPLKDIRWNFLIGPTRLISTIGAALLFGFIVLGERFLALVYGSDKTVVWGYAVALLVPMYLNMINGVCVNVLDALRKRLMRSLIIAATALVSILLSLVLIQFMGLWGVVASISLSLLFGNVIGMSVYYRKALGIPILTLYGKALNGILPCAVLAGAVTYVAGIWMPKNVIGFLLLGILFCLVYLATLLLFGWNKTERQAARNSFSKLLHKMKGGKRT